MVSRESGHHRRAGAQPNGAHRTSANVLARVLVMRGSRASIVDLRQLYATNLNGLHVVSLADVWVAAQLPGDLFSLTFDFIDDDGGRGAQGGGPKLDNGHFVKGWIDLDTRDLVWGDDAEVGSQWRLKSVSTIVVDEIAEVVPPLEAGGMR